MLAAERVIHSYVHQGRIGVLVELGTETDYAIRSQEFVAFMHELGLHIAASAPGTVPELLAQPFVKDSSVTVAQLLASLIAALREHVVIARFVRWDTQPRLSREPEPPSAPAVARRA
jgi:elongation factor Ts